MAKRLLAIALIFGGASLAWFVLGTTLFTRTVDSDTEQTARLGAQWGSAQVQQAPAITTETAQPVYNKAAKRVDRVFVDTIIPLRSSSIKVDLRLDRRRKGLLWYNLYDVAFRAHYRVRNTTANRQLTVQFHFPSADGSYRNFSYSIGGKPVNVSEALASGKATFALEPGKETSIDVAYQSRGMNSWCYEFGKGIQSVQNLSFVMTTDFDAIDFPSQTLLPVSKTPSGNGWTLNWNYSTLLTGNGIGLTVPFPLQPGPLAQRITFWAPVALLFYLFVMFTITTLRRIDLHPVNYFFLAAAFFAFHLLFAYLVDRIQLEIAFAICSVVSIFLTVSYLRVVAGFRFAAVESGLAQLIYLVLFSYALFNEGWSGLAITTGAIVTLFVVMQVTAKINWSQRFAV